MDTNRINVLRDFYNKEMEQVEETVTLALCETYQAVTGKEPSNHFRDKLIDAIRFHL